MLLASCTTPPLPYPTLILIDVLAHCFPPVISQILLLTTNPFTVFNYPLFHYSYTQPDKQPVSLHPSSISSCHLLGFCDLLFSFYIKEFSCIIWLNKDSLLPTCLKKEKTCLLFQPTNPFCCLPSFPSPPSFSLSHSNERNNFTLSVSLLMFVTKISWAAYFNGNFERLRVHFWFLHVMS